MSENRGHLFLSAGVAVDLFSSATFSSLLIVKVPPASSSSLLIVLQKWQFARLRRECNEVSSSSLKRSLLDSFAATSFTTAAFPSITALPATAVTCNTTITIRRLPLHNFNNIAIFNLVLRCAQVKVSENPQSKNN
ncbi:uncharacterized protein SEPMUDRAFT_119026 [Sphaerulina musiva SO2202]|uniref:Uncharacterized protein n=1 Tax=Sphaerulina musiva (strain SO2202) TaxID=692275 RepID=N1QE03_SPHMS|nr:uncharacterized protein SEPMUDRAFT_119026 [Sphaerulina musiva SO2202]EMF10475.1 hypothetical protein SEPMUDRAFT_119026 [Sphaerulina musiva SO2202]